MKEEGEEGLRELKRELAFWNFDIHGSYDTPLGIGGEEHCLNDTGSMEWRGQIFRLAFIALVMKRIC